LIKQSPIQVIFLSFLLVSCASLPANAQPEEPAFIVITKNPDDQVDIQYENDTALIDIQSPTGVGSATFELDSSSMPGNLTLRLHLKGLEGFRLTSAQDQISASVSSGDTAAVDSQSIVSSGTESPLLPGHPLWMEIELAAGQAEKYFEVTVPPEFIREAGKTFEIEWIDFYR
jgi:hypothetical protein